MASIIKKKIRGQVYYYAVESKRVNGKPRIVWQKYLGKVDDIVRAVSAGGKSGPSLARIYSFGVEAALLGIARRLGVEEIINKYAGRAGAVPGAGEYILIYTLNACAGPGTGLSRWYGRTVLRRHFKISPKMLTEKRFWGAAESLSEEALEKIQHELAGRILAEFGVGTGALLYRGLEPGHVRCKGLRAALHVPGIELLVSSDFLVPLFYAAFPAGFPDEVDARRCPEGLAAKYRRLVQPEPDITIVERRRCIFGGNVNWSNEEIHRAIAGRAELEELLGRISKGAPVLSCRPERKEVYLRVHIFCLVLGLALQTLLRRELHRCGIEGSIPGILKILAGIREVAVVYAGDEHRRRRREYLTLTEMDPVQKEIYECLGLSRFEAGG